MTYPPDARRGTASDARAWAVARGFTPRSYYVVKESILAGIVLLVFSLFMATIAVLIPASAERCTVTLPTGETVTRYGCYTGIRGSGVLYCDEVDYAPAAWVTVTCEGSRP